MYGIYSPSGSRLGGRDPYQIDISCVQLLSLALSCSHVIRIVLRTEVCTLSVSFVSPKGSRDCHVIVTASKVHPATSRRPAQHRPGKCRGARGGVCTARERCDQRRMHWRQFHAGLNISMRVTRVLAVSNPADVFLRWASNLGPRLSLLSNDST